MDSVCACAPGDTLPAPSGSQSMRLSPSPFATGDFTKEKLSLSSHPLLETVHTINSESVGLDWLPAHLIYWSTSVVPRSWPEPRNEHPSYLTLASRCLTLAKSSFKWLRKISRHPWMHKKDSREQAGFSSMRGRHAQTTGSRRGQFSAPRTCLW